MLNLEKLSYYYSDQKYSKQIVEEAVVESEIILIQHEKYNRKKIKHEKYNSKKYNTKNITHMYNEKLNYTHQNFQ